MNLPFLIVADRGGFKAYAVERNDTGSAHVPRLVEHFTSEEARGRYRDKYTDQAGAFPSASSPGQANSIAERMNLEAEQEMRSFRAVAARMIDLVREQAPARWAFAAPSEIHSAILDGVPPDVKQSLVRNIHRDLVNTPPPELLRHFETA